MNTLANEINSIPSKLVASFNGASDVINLACEDWHREPTPKMLMTIGRGTSDFAATFAAHQFTSLVKVPVGSFTPSLASLGNFSLDDEVVKALAISQSGMSPDIIAALKSFNMRSRWAITNVDDSKLEQAANIRIPMGVGVEESVAATKTFAAALLLIHTLACKIANRELPNIDEIETAATKGMENPIDLDPLAFANSTFVIGRGTTLCIAQEAAIKIKELTGLHAEAISAAEVMHGPKALVGPKLPILAFASPDEVGESVIKATEDLAELKCPMIIYKPKANEVIPAMFETLCAFYQAVPTLAINRGFDPNQPKAIAKVTETI